MIENTTGILQPQLQNRWKIEFDLEDQVSLQAVECTIDYCSRMLWLSVEQPIVNDVLHRLFYNLSKSNDKCKMSVISMDGEETETAKITINGQLISHSFRLDYAASAAATHHVTFSFDHVESFENKNHSLYRIPSEFE